MALNHYLINQTVKGKMVPAGGSARFGRFGLLGTVGTMLKHRPRTRARVPFSIDTDTLVYNAFMEVHGEASAETLLIDPALAARFHTQARKLGYHAPAADLNRRLLNIRKNPARYKEHGLILPDTTEVKVTPSIVPQYAHVIEFSLARLRSRYGVTIDDILIDPEFGAKYDEMVHAVAPDITPRELRLAALYIRKTRYISKQNEKLVESLNADRIEVEFQPVTAVELKPEEGIIELLENHKHLYISRSENLRAAVEQITNEDSLKFMANEFWQPKRENLLVRIFAGHSFLKIPVSQWQLKLIADKKPVFNWPIAA